MASSKLSPILLFAITILVFIVVTIIGTIVLSVVAECGSSPTDKNRRRGRLDYRDIESLSFCPTRRRDKNARTRTPNGLLHPGTRERSRLRRHPSADHSCVDSGWTIELSPSCPALFGTGEAAVVRVTITPPTPAKRNVAYH
ncbi:hypothetical protein BDN71DRAFT_1511804 [Pleurotus eryngii]|uniref:Uncharacterized protein n=1 Tax=Pleurotus eryngii TaxID=5323 RepID=A0A9P5ZP57_PLEER|nr:hypothetical protein BDN71DRAFT_1511804 [Pleurotus eryngii]